MPHACKERKTASVTIYYFIDKTFCGTQYNLLKFIVYNKNELGMFLQVQEAAASQNSWGIL